MSKTFLEVSPQIYSMSNSGQIASGGSNPPPSAMLPSEQGGVSVSL